MAVLRDSPKVQWDLSPPRINVGMKKHIKYGTFWATKTNIYTNWQPLINVAIVPKDFPIHKSFSSNFLR